MRRWLKRLLGVPPPAPPLPPGMLVWACNLCGSRNQELAEAMDRETGTCGGCGSIMRDRGLGAILAERLFGLVLVWADAPERPGLRGLGMSDHHCYARFLERKCAYTNTFFDREPFFDVTRPDPEHLGAYDFVITSDVFEHVPPPAQRAFDALAALLKPGGVAVFSVPYSLRAETDEHYPNLHEYRIDEEPDGTRVLRNLTAAGTHEEFRNLLFHGGHGSTLEMREFSLAAVERHFAAAGFEDLRLHREPHFRHGIFWRGERNLLMSARKPN